MRKRWIAILGVTAGIGLAGPADAEAPVKAVASIQPVHSLVAGVMEGVGEPMLLIRGGGSPHTYSLRPSEAQALQEAAVVVRVSEHLETFLNRPIESLAGSAHVLTLDEADGMTLHAMREGGVWDVHDHGHEHEHGHADHDRDRDHDHNGHAHNDHSHNGNAHDRHEHERHGDSSHDHDEHAHDDHGHDDHAHGDHGHADHDHADHAHDGHSHEHAHDADHHHHHHGDHDAHLWLDPENAKAAVTAIAEALSEADPENADAYRANAGALHARLDDLHAELVAATQAIADKPFIVFHDAYQYFEHRYGLTPAGSITVSPERQPGARRLSELRARVNELGGTCVFAEPQFEPRLVHTVTEGTQASAGVLDPLGADIEPGPDLYFDLMRGLARSLNACLAN